MAKARRQAKRSGTSLFWVLKKGGRPERFDETKSIVRKKDGTLEHHWDWICCEGQGEKRWKTRAEWMMENEMTGVA